MCRVEQAGAVSPDGAGVTVVTRYRVQRVTEIAETNKMHEQ